MIVNFILKHKYWFLAAVVLITGIYIYYINRSSTSNTNSSRIITQKVTKGNIESYVSASGTIQTANFLAITTSVNGVVKKVYVKEGDVVKRGQKIMDITLDSEGERSRLSAYANLVRAQNSLQDAKDGLYSLKSMLETKEKAFKNVKDNTNYSNDDERYQFHIAENDYMSAKSNYDAQQNVIVQAQLALESASKDYQAQSPVILAPGEGVISNITAVEGSKISNSVTSDRSIQTVASIKQPGTPILSLNLSEVDIPKVKVGQSVNIKLNSLPDSEFKGSVVGIDKIGQITSGVTSYPVVVKFETENDNVFPNMNVSAKIITDSRSGVILVPTSAITNSNGKKLVKVLRNGNSIEVEVSTGISDNTNTEVLSGLSEGDTVALNTLPTTGFLTSSTTGNTTNSRNQRNNSGFNLFGIFGGQQRR